MFNRKNTIASILTWIGIAEILSGIVLGIVLGKMDIGFYSDERVWWITLLWWIGGFISGMFVIGLSEIIEQLHKLNSKSDNSKLKNSDDFVLLND